MTITGPVAHQALHGTVSVSDITEHAMVYVVDDDAEVRESLAELLQSIGWSVKTYASAEDFLDSFDPTLPACLLVDVCMPGMSGLELQQQLAAHGWDIPWVVITAHANVPMAVEAMAKGASGFLEKPYRSHELLALIKKAVNHDFSSRLGKARRREVLARFGQLSPREMQVMELVTAGEPNKQIARALEISERTVEVHRAKVMRKLSAATLAELIHLAAEYQAMQVSHEAGG